MVHFTPNDGSYSTINTRLSEIKEDIPGNQIHTKLVDTQHELIKSKFVDKNEITKLR